MRVFLAAIDSCADATMRALILGLRAAGHTLSGPNGSLEVIDDADAIVAVPPLPTTALLQVGYARGALKAVFLLRGRRRHGVSLRALLDSPEDEQPTVAQLVARITASDTSRAGEQP